MSASKKKSAAKPVKAVKPAKPSRSKASAKPAKPARKPTARVVAKPAPARRPARPVGLKPKPRSARVAPAPQVAFQLPLMPAHLTTAVRALDDKKAMDIRVLQLGQISSVADFLVVATGNSEPHLRALRIELERVLDAAG
jgi:ribosome-associated protein